MTMVDTGAGAGTYPPATAIVVPALAATGVRTVFAGACILIGGCFVGGATAGTVQVFDNTQAADPLAATAAFAANGSAEILLGVPGVRCYRGVTVKVTKATAESVVYVIPLT